MNQLMPEQIASNPTNSSRFNTEIKRIPHPIKVPKAQDKIVLNYRFEEVIGYGIITGSVIILLHLHLLGAWGKVKRGWDVGEDKQVEIKILRKRRISRKIRDGINKIYR